MFQFLNLIIFELRPNYVHSDRPKYQIYVIIANESMSSLQYKYTI